MIQEIQDYTDIAKTLPVLKEAGVFIVHNYLQGESLQSLGEEVLKLCEEKGRHYEFGRSYRGGSLAGHGGFFAPHVFKAFNQQWMRSLNENYKNQKFCANIFATHDYISTLDYAPNGWLHSDKKNCLKFFIYLTDVDETSGAFYCSPGSVGTGRKLRQKMIRDNNYSARVDSAWTKTLEVEFPEVIDEYPPEAVNGTAGTLIVFDTDTFHMGGRVEENRSRLVVRGHCF